MNIKLKLPRNPLCDFRIVYGNFATKNIRDGITISTGDLQEYTSGIVQQIINSGFFVQKLNDRLWIKDCVWVYLCPKDADLHMTGYELYGYEAFWKHFHDDERVIEWATMDTIDRDKVQEYLLKKRAERPGFRQLSEEQALEMLNITQEGKLTLAAVMNFCVYPQGTCPNWQ